jgi:hypothetical protein
MAFLDLCCLQESLFTEAIIVAESTTPVDPQMGLTDHPEEAGSVTVFVAVPDLQHSVNRDSRNRALPSLSSLLSSLLNNGAKPISQYVQDDTPCHLVAVL